MTAKLVVAAGFIIFRRINMQIEYLMLQTSYGIHHWTPPKGHVDPGESELEAAYRETSEEAGLRKDQLEVIDNFRKDIYYDVRGSPKKVIYWLARVRDPNAPVILSSEHQCFKWLNLDATIEIAGYPEMQEIFRNADTFIKNHDKDL